jgi:hypothetical protein
MRAGVGMAANAWGTLQKTVEEIFFQNDVVSVCLLVNRRTKTMRVIDFRAGPAPAKRAFVLSLAKREGVEKAYTLVERDEVATWVKLGFAKEGSLPGFYKRSDAFLLGCFVPALPGSSRVESETRIVAAEPAEGDANTDRHDFAERTLAHAKKLAKEPLDRPLPTVKVAILREADVRKPLAAAFKSGRALTAFESFGRDVERRYFSLTARGGFEVIASTECQTCFGNAFVELLHGPKSDSDRVSMVAALSALCDKLTEEAVVSTFALSPSDNPSLASVFVANGFRRTGLLQGQLVVGDVRKDAIIWSRKLANPGEE